MKNFVDALASIEKLFEDQKIFGGESNITRDNISEAFDSISISRVTQSITLSPDRDSNQSHIAITGERMDMFPYLFSYNYHEKPTADTSFKRRFIFKLPVLLSSHNFDYIKDIDIKNENSMINTYTFSTRSRRKNGPYQIELSYKREDHPTFIKFRESLSEDDYLIILKYTKELKYLFLAVKGEDAPRYNMLSNIIFFTRKGAPPTHVGIENLLADQEELEIKKIHEKPFIDNNDLLKDKHIKNMLEILKRNPNLILYGPPGTGKTYYTNKLTNFFDHTETVTFHQSYSYEQFIEGITAELNGNNGQLNYFVKDGLFLKLCKLAKENPHKNYALIIDEINRGNISKIFGELITLIEKSKRDGQSENISVKLPYSNDPFSVPNNLSIIATMNTSDKSVALIDIALRRRFAFYEIMPDFSLIPNKNKYILTSISAVKEINKKIIDFINKEHIIGHSYFFNLSDSSDAALIKDIKYIWLYQILPLLQEYYYANPKDITSLLGNLVMNENQNYSFSINYDITDDELIESLDKIVSKG